MNMPTIHSWLALAASIGSANAQASSCSASAPSATVDEGVLRGTSTSLPDAAPVNQFLGVPFAQSPPKRFAPPERAARAREPIDATEYSAACIQQFSYPELSRNFTIQVFNNPPPEESEDCLYLNVFAPSTPAPADGRSVLYWIYGGGLAFGNAGQEAYDGSFFAAYEDVIVVTVNYRTNVFGFAPSPELPLEERNLGYLDQRMGLDWVQRNIARFGGSPDKVTIFGESAGAGSVDSLLTSYGPDSHPPFRGAILQSGQSTYELESTSSTPSWFALAEALSCPGNHTSNLTCLRDASATDIKSAIELAALSFTPTPDNYTFVSDPAARRASNRIAPIPALAGTTAQEGRAFTIGENDTTAYLTSLLGGPSNTTSTLISALTTAYPLNSPGITTQYDQIAAIFTDLQWTCPAARWTAASASAGIPTWRFYFNASFPNTQLFPNAGAFHASDIPIVFGTYPVPGATTQEYALSNAMRGAWARFAKNPAMGPGWNRVGTGAEGAVLDGAREEGVGGVLADGEGEVLKGDFSLGVFGDVDRVRGGGVTVLDRMDVDARCEIFEALYAAAEEGAGGD